MENEPALIDRTRETAEIEITFPQGQRKLSVIMNKAVFDCNSYVKHLHFLDLVHAAQALLIAGAQTTNDNTGL